jgi:hypothetical protein
MDEQPAPRARIPAPLVPLEQAAQAEPVRPARREVTLARAVVGVVTAVALGAVFRFPLQVLLVLSFAGLGVVIARRWRLGGLVGSTVFAAGFLAQATSIFVTPFTWWMRFTFFTVMLGALVLLIVWQTREL